MPWTWCKTPSLRLIRIAEILDVPIGAVRSRLHRVRLQIVQSLGNEEAMGGSYARIRPRCARLRGGRELRRANGQRYVSLRE